MYNGATSASGALRARIRAATIATQNQAWSNRLSVWSAIQELGTNLSGRLTSFTFRVYTNLPHLSQFDYTFQNTRIYDKDNNNSVVFGCLPSGNVSDPLEGLTFNISNVPSGYEDVTIDFSCRNYDFIPGHRYLATIGNANTPNQAVGRIQFAAGAYGPGGSQTTDFFPGGGLRYAFDNSTCDITNYVWNSQSSNNGCNVWTSTKDDIYFVLNNNAPPPRLPVVFIPGIGGSELKASQDIIWSSQDGHGGTYSHGYNANEKIWVNQDEAAKLGDDDYFDVLRLKPDGVTSEASLNLTGNLTPFGYSDIDSFFTNMGYVKGTNFFVYPYDWRKDVRSTQTDLDALIETAKQKSGQSKVNLVVHSMGGLVARYYISDSQKAVKVNKLIELGVPHLGSVDSLKTLRYGSWLGYDFRLFTIGIPPSETKDDSQNMPSAFELLPSLKYYDFYNGSDKNLPVPYKDDRDIDNNNVIGSLNYSQTKTLLSNLGHNMTVFGLSEQFHNLADPILNQTNDTKIYEIVGSNQPTLGQIAETWWITWPINLIPKQDEIFINGDDTVPLYSASLKSDNLDISGATKIYYVEQKHGDLVNGSGTAMQTVKSILNDDNSLPVDVKDQKIPFEGQQVSVDDADLNLYDDNGNHTGLNSSGDVETKIPNTFYDSLGKTKHIFVKKTAAKTTVKITSTKTNKVKVKIRNYSQDSIVKTIQYNDVPISNSSIVQFVLDPNSSITPTLTSGTQTILATSEVTGNAALDQTAPTTAIQISGTKNSSGIYTGPVTITLTGSDSGSGILRIEYSLDNGKTVQTYTGPFIINTQGKTTIQIKSIDKLGNEEIPQTIIIEINTPPSPTTSPTPTPTSAPATSNNSSDTGASSSNSNSTNQTTSSDNSNSANTTPSPAVIPTQPSILGVSFKNPSHISDEINVSHILDKPENVNVSKITSYTPKEILGGLLIVSGGIITLALLGLLATFSPLTNLFFKSRLPFVKPFPK